jgi:hypothetical protein
MLAAVLHAAGIALIVVGSLARRLGGEDVHPHDLDILVARTPANLRSLSHVLEKIGARQLSAQQFETSFGLLDVFFTDAEPQAHSTFDNAGMAIPFDPRPRAV